MRRKCANTITSYTTTILHKIFVDFPYFRLYLFTATETGLDYYHQNVDVRIFWQVAEPLKDLSKSKKLKKSLKCFELMVSIHPATKKTKFYSWAEKVQKISCKTFHRKTYFPYIRELVYNILSMIVLIVSYQIWTKINASKSEGEKHEQDQVTSATDLNNWKFQI